MAATYKLSDADLIAHLGKQLEFMKASSAAFDIGMQDEAQRIATAIRVLLHDTGASKSVLAQLGVKDQLFYVDTAPVIHPSNLLATPGLVMGRVAADVGGSYVAPLGDLAPPRIRPPREFNGWWERPVTKLPEGTLYSRRDYVLTVANKGGGAHVDPELDARWVALTRDNALGWMYFEAGENVIEKPFDRDPALASVRQIAYELEQTFADQLRIADVITRHDLLSPNRQVVITPSVGRNDPCPCGSGRKYKKCHGA